MFIYRYSKVRESLYQVLWVSTLALKIIWEAPIALVAASSIIFLADCFDIDGAAFINNLRESWVQCPKKPARLISMVSSVELYSHYCLNHSKLVSSDYSNKTYVYRYMCLYLTKYTSLVGVVACVRKEWYVSLNHRNKFLTSKMAATIRKYTDVYPRAIFFSPIAEHTRLLLVHVWVEHMLRPVLWWRPTKSLQSSCSSFSLIETAWTRTSTRGIQDASTRLL